jgi:putative transposase
VRQARRVAARRGCSLRIMFADEARFGRMNRPRPCWAPRATRPQVASQLIREYVYLYGAVSPKDGTCVYLILPAPDTQCFQIFLDTLAKKYRRQLILLFVDGAGNHQSDDLEVPDNVILHVLPAYSPELNPQENLWDEIREKIFKNYALKSMDEVYAKLEDAALYIERNPARRQIHHVVPLHR